MNRKVMITCALTGAGDTVGRSEHVPVTPEQIAESGIAAARAGATIIHIHVRDPETGVGSRDVALYREVVERVRASDVDVIINTTAGMGGDLVLDPHDPTTFVEGTDPEVFLFVEVRKGADGPDWQYALTPMTCYVVKAKRNGREIWTEHRDNSQPTGVLYGFQFWPERL